MHHATLLWAGALVFDNQPLGLPFASREVRIPDFGVIVELDFNRRQITEDIFGVLRDRVAGGFERARPRSRILWHRRD